MGSLRAICGDRIRSSIIRETDSQVDTHPYQSNKNKPQNRHTEYYDPDKLFKTAGAVAFIYTTDGAVYYGDERTTHYQIIGSNKDLLVFRYNLKNYYRRHGIKINIKESSSSLPRSASSGSLSPISANSESPSWKGSSSSSRWIDSRGDEMEPRDVAIAMGDLLGRIGEQKSFVSFWNHDPSQYDGYLRPCLERLIADGQLNSDAKVSTPTHGTISMDEALGGAQGQALTDAQREQMELYKRLHLMRGKEKQDAMKKLGVGGGDTPHPVAAAMDKVGLRTPGQKWWALHSESFAGRLNNALDNALDNS